MIRQNDVSAVILTFNSSASIERTLRAAVAISDDVHVVDSFSTDDTLDICRRFGASVRQRAFKNYADQRNWAISNLPLKHEWQIHIDADEELSTQLLEEVARIDFSDTPFDGFLIGRKIVFLGRTLRFGGIAWTWHYRLFRKGFGRCEQRLYDQHFVPEGKVGTLDAYMLDHQEQSLALWTHSHNRWSDMEAVEVASEEAQKEGQVSARFTGTPIHRKRYFKSRYYRLPLFWRVFAYLAYRYVIRLGFLDGYRGLVYHVLQGFWFRFLVDAKIYELKLAWARETAPAAGKEEQP